MKISPLKNYRVPRYPTEKEIKNSPELLEILPARWKKPSGLAIIAGIGLISKTLSGAPSSGEPAKKADTPAAQMPEKHKDSKKVKQQEESAKNAIVVPVLEEALKCDGRGAFGCVVVNPPTFLSEDEALEIIQKEFAKAGIKLKEDVTVKNILAPNPEASSFPTGSDDKENQDNLTLTEYDFDFASEDGSILIEYLSSDDYEEWSEKKGYISSVSSYDFPKMVAKVSDAFGKYKTDQKKIFGIFFDPLASADDIPPPDLSGIKDPKIREIAFSEFYRKMTESRKNLKKKAENKLKQQLTHFIDYLQKEDYIKKPEAD